MSKLTKPTPEELKKRLTQEQFEVTQNEATEPPFKNKYWDHHSAGIYVDIVSGEPLFSSLDKYDSGTGWPSFTRSIEIENIEERSDRRLIFGERTEVHSKLGGSHLGHVFKDGPEPTGLRYCINSASLRFVSVEELKKEGYEKFQKLFSHSDRQNEKATFAGGCFWCMVSPFAQQVGVKEVVAGYTGGKKENPNYEDVSGGESGHVEAIQITFDPKIISYEQLLKIYWKNIDPTDVAGQFCDRGAQYRSAVFYHSEAQKKDFLTSKAALAQEKKLEGKPIVTEGIVATPFYRAEEYHQNYYKKNPVRYKFYRSRCGRDRTLEKLWGTTPAH